MEDSRTPAYLAPTYNVRHRKGSSISQTKMPACHHMAMHMVKGQSMLKEDPSAYSPLHDFSLQPLTALLSYYTSKAAEHPNCLCKSHVSTHDAYSTMDVAIHLVPKRVAACTPVTKHTLPPRPLHSKKTATMATSCPTRTIRGLPPTTTTSIAALAANQSTNQSINQSARPAASKSQNMLIQHMQYANRHATSACPSTAEVC